MFIFFPRFRHHYAVLFTLALASIFSPSASQALDLSIQRAQWSSLRDLLRVDGAGTSGLEVTIRNAFDPSQVLASQEVIDEAFRIRLLDPPPSPVPCRIRVEQSDGMVQERDVRNAPADCAPKEMVPPGQDNPPVCSIDAPTAITTSINIGGMVNFAATVVDEDPSTLSFLWDFAGAAANITEQNPGTVLFTTPGTFGVTFTATDAAQQSCITQVRVIEVDEVFAMLPPPVVPVSNSGLLGTDFPGYVVLGANDLGMHCADQDDRIFSVLPPFNVLHAQVIERGTGGNLPRILNNTEVSVAYSAASSATDPAGVDSINSTSKNFSLNGSSVPLVFKGNFWDQDPTTGNPIGFDVYAPLFFGLLTDPAVVPQDLGLPAPETSLLQTCLPPPFGNGSGDCGFAQQAMPGISSPYYVNQPQMMHFDADVGFFNDLLGGVIGVDGNPLGGLISGANWFRADGIPLLPVDDMGRSNAYPLVRVQAFQGGSALASTDVVLPVAAEADCQGCHLDPNALCSALGLTCEGQAASFASQAFTVVDLDDAADLAGTPGDNNEQKVLNAAKINILRLHDAMHATALDTTLNNPPSNPKVVCASCHYSPALDLAQVGPTDTPANSAGAGLPGTEQTRHISMTRAMHGHHGELVFNGQKLFPDMPPPDQRNVGDALPILEQTCYQCHPGKRTKCLRGAMGGSGIVCQDCHGNMTQVGNDFTADFPNNPGNGDLTKRVSWASEPKCMSCHTGDAVTPNHPAGSIVAPDGIRLLQAYTAAEHIDQGGDATVIVSTSSRFAENETLYRLSGNDDGSNKGHAGLMCEGCHGSTHAIWPNANPFANDNVAARQLQGHTGTLMECTTCHDQASLNNLILEGKAMQGPHGIHPINSPKWIKGDGPWHGKIAKIENDKPGGGACGACHGVDHQGTVLSRTPVNRVLRDEDGKSQATVQAGDIISCDLCHSMEKSFDN